MGIQKQRAMHLAASTRKDLKKDITVVGGDLSATWHGVRPRPRLLCVVNIGGRAELRLRSNAAISDVILYTPAYSITGTYWNP